MKEYGEAIKKLFVENNIEITHITSVLSLIHISNTATAITATATAVIAYFVSGCQRLRHVSSTPAGGNRTVNTAANTLCAGTRLRARFA